MNTAQSARAAETFRLPPELSGTVPRDVRLTPGGVALAVMAIAIAVGAVVSAIAMSIAYARADGARQLREREGVEVQAQVVQVVRRGGEHPRRVVTYRYEAEGRSHTGRTVLRRSDRRDLSQGGLVPIRYVASDPEVSWMAGYEPSAFPLWTIPLVSTSLLAAAAAMAWALRRQWTLLSEGRAAPARITGYQKVRVKEHKKYRVSYEFQTLSGARRTARYEVGKTPPPIGSLVPIVYHRDKPQWIAAYPLQLVRVSGAQRPMSPVSPRGASST